jgi:hypothetical protein
MFGEFLSSSEANRLQRQNEVNHIIKALPQHELLAELGDPKNLSLLSLSSATNRYVTGLFEECIFNSSFSVEIALLLELDRKLSSEEKIKEKDTIGSQTKIICSISPC